MHATTPINQQQLQLLFVDRFVVSQRKTSSNVASCNNVSSDKRNISFVRKHSTGELVSPSSTPSNRMQHTNEVMELNYGKQRKDETNYNLLKTSKCRGLLDWNFVLLALRYSKAPTPRTSSIVLNQVNL